MTNLRSSPSSLFLLSVHSTQQQRKIHMLLCCIVADSTKGRSRVKVPFLSFFFRLSHLDWLACVSGGGPVGHGDSCFSLFSFCPVLSCLSLVPHTLAFFLCSAERVPRVRGPRFRGWRSLKKGLFSLFLSLSASPHGAKFPTFQHVPSHVSSFLELSLSGLPLPLASHCN